MQTYSGVRGNVTINITVQERRLRILLRFLGFLFAFAAVGYLLPALAGPNKNSFIHLPFVTNSAVKVSVMSILAFIAAADVRRFSPLTLVIIWGHIISEIAVFAALIWANTNVSLTFYFPFFTNPFIIPVSNILWGSIILDGVVILFLIWFYLTAEAARYNLRYLTPTQFRTLISLAEVVVAGENEILSAEQVARNADRYFSSFKGKTKWIAKLVLSAMQIYPLFSLHPPLSYMDPESRLEFLKKRFYRDITLRLVPAFIRTFLQAMIRMGKQLCYLGYYNDPSTFESIKYVPFSKRHPELHKNNFPPYSRKALAVNSSKEVLSDNISGDIVVIGSGAAASVLAYNFAKEGRSVLMLERGEHTDPTEFNEDEIDMLSRLYADGALQLSRDFRFQVIQGSCVGGTTVINNAVCFDLPFEVLDRWNSRPIDARIDAERLLSSFKKVRTLMGVEHQTNGYERQRLDFLNHGAQKFVNGIECMRLHLPPNITMEVEANIHDCLGCGYCNIGCKYGKKLSMLDTVLPYTQNTYGKDALKIVAGCEVKNLKKRGNKIVSAECEFSDGRKLSVSGNVFVVAAGAVSSSILLLRSSIGGSNAGKNLSFNMGSPITALFDESVNSYDGLQISHYLKLAPSRGFIIETWYNPPVAQALTMPGWFEDHFNNMLRYDKLVCTGVLVPTRSNAEVRKAGLTGREVKYTPDKNDLNALIEGLILSGEIFFAAGAKAVMPATFKYYEFENKEELMHLPELVKDSSDITLGTGHPQGGNIISSSKSTGVIDPDFKVFDYSNLYIADASVFPTSVGVNPQLTVMALADYASASILNGKKV